MPGYNYVLCTLITLIYNQFYNHVTLDMWIKHIRLLFTFSPLMRHKFLSKTCSVITVPDLIFSLPAATENHRFSDSIVPTCSARIVQMMENSGSKDGK